MKRNRIRSRVDAVESAQTPTKSGWLGKTALTVLGLAIGLAIIGAGVAFALAFFGFVIGVVRGGTDKMCDFRTQVLVQQIPPSLDILAVRHPISVGLARKYFNDKGQIDSFVQEVISAFAKSDSSTKNDNLISCALQTVVKLNPDEIRGKIADQAESDYSKRLALAGA